MINLDEQYSRIGHKRFSNMVINREEKYSVLEDQKEELELKIERLIKTTDMSDTHYDRLKNILDEFQSELDKLEEWIHAARPLYSRETWNQIVKTGWFFDDDE